VKVVGFGLSSLASVVTGSFLVCFGLPLQTLSLGVFFAGIGKFGSVAQSDAFASCAVWLGGCYPSWVRRARRKPQAAGSVFG
ncbi:MAG: hypothetical protein Q8N96_00960, partial [Methylovulum sp.]|nr:hypothetical protein [Methylovulum sp.]